MDIVKSILCLFIPLVMVSCASQESTDKPNVIIIMTDDKGFGDLGFYGNHHIKTTVIDKFAGERVRFDDFWCRRFVRQHDQLLLGKFDLPAVETDIIPVVLIKEKDKTTYQMPFYFEVKRM